MKDNKSKLAATTAKVVAALVIPGGFIFWGAYELGKFMEKNKGRKVEETEVSNSSEVQRQEET